MDPSNGAAVASDDDLIADATFGFAIGACAGNAAGGLIQKTLLVGRCGDGSCPADSFFQRVHDLIHTGDDQDLFGAINDSANPVAAAVDIDHLAIQAQAVGTGEEYVSKHQGLNCDCWCIRSYNSDSIWR